jgi:ribosomal-protein-alanine N-acetyltransferase
MLISKLTFKDAQVAAMLHQQAFYKGWQIKDFEDFLREASIKGLKTTANNEVVGFVLWRELLDEAEILTIVVRGDSKRKGIGSFILDSLFTELKQKGILNLFIEVAEDDEGAQLFYKAHGFEFVNKRSQYYKRESGKKVSALIFIKRFY